MRWPLYFYNRLQNTTCTCLNTLCGLVASTNPLALINDHILIPHHHLHLTLYHEVLVIWRQRLRPRVVHELRQILVVLEHKRADRIIIQHLCLPVQHISHDLTIAVQAIRLQGNIYLSPLLFYAGAESCVGLQDYT